MLLDMRKVLGSRLGVEEAGQVKARGCRHAFLWPKRSCRKHAFLWPETVMHEACISVARQCHAGTHNWVSK